MLKRIVEKHQDENFSGIENARKYAEGAVPPGMDVASYAICTRLERV